MISKVESAIRIFREDGPTELGKELALYFGEMTPLTRSIIYWLSKRQIRNRMISENGSLDSILDTVLEVKPGYRPYEIRAMQLRDEIKELAKLLEEENPSSALEIGTAKGGTFYLWTRFLDLDEITSLDLPNGRFGGGYDKRKTNIFRDFNPAVDTNFIRANSHSQETFEEVQSKVDGGVDFLFIDADHTYEGAKQDFEMYSDLVNEGGIIALHDIAKHPDEKSEVDRRKREISSLEGRHISWGESSQDCNVDQLWEEIVEDYNTSEIISHPSQTWAGIGIVEM